MAMIKRLMHFEALSESSNPVVSEVGKKLLDQAKRAVPSAITPESR